MSPFSLDSIQVRSRLYLTAAPGLQAGTRLRGGHFRKAVEEGAATDHGSILELVWELVRASEFPSRPCRFDVLFLWQGEAHARAWHHRQTILGPETGSERGLYQVEVEGISRIWAADMNLISYIGEGETVGALMQRARRYWGSPSTKSDPEILLGGEVRVRRDLRALSLERITPIQDASVDEQIRGLLRSDGSGRSRLESRRGRYLLDPGITVMTDPPMPLAGWIGLEIEGTDEVLRPQRGTEAILVNRRGPLRYRPDDEDGGCGTSFVIEDAEASEAAAECLSGKRRFRPVLICDREAAHYWQLPTCWEGRVSGEWSLAGT